MNAELRALEPCPFCGGPAMECHVSEPSIQCERCPVGMVGETEEEAAEAWSRRSAAEQALSAPPQGVSEALQAAHDLIANVAFGDGVDVEWANAVDAKTQAALAYLSAAPPHADEPVTVTYTNWRGETAVREIRPKRMWFGSTEWHPEPQWLITAVDTGKGAERDFALSGFGCAPAAQAAVPAWQTEAMPLEAWTEEDGSVLWWKFPVEEPPYVGTPLDCGMTVEAHTTTRLLTQMDQEHDPEPVIHRIHVGGWPGYHTHWTRIALPAAPLPSQPAEGGRG